SNLSEPILRETAGALPIDKEHPLEQHSSTLFSEEGVLVDDNVDSEVLQHFYRYYREAVCEHSRRQIGNVNHPLVRQRFQRLFEVYTEMFHKSQFGRERLMSNVFLDIQEDELQVDVSQNFYSSFAVTSRSLNTENTRMSTTASRLHHRRHAASSAGRHNSGAQGSNSVFSVHSGHGSDAMPYSSMQLGRSAANRFSSVPPSTRRSAMHELTESFVRDRDAGAAGSPMSMAGGARIRNSMGEEMMPIAAPVSDKEIKILEALEDELQLAKEELFEVTEMVPILLVPTMVDARFTPQAWMLFLEGAYCVLYFLICVYESSTVPGYGGWLVYNSVYFRYVNSCSSVGLVVNALLRRVYLDEPILAYDPFIVTALALMGPAIFSHIIPGIVLYAWIHALVLIVWLPCCWIMRQLEKRFFYTLDPISILFRVCFRLGTTIV
ncbi:transmembrane protein, putative, partial [Bodo saltans]